MRLLPLLLLLLAGVAHAEIPLEARVIVKYKSQSPLKQALALDRSASLASRLGLPLLLGRQIDASSESIHASGIGSEELAARLSREADVEYAVPDRLRRIRAVPNDTLFSNQWHLQSVQPAAIRATEAWDISTGSANVIVAVIDTGVRIDHPELAAKLLPGYDFVSDAANAGDGDARDDDASDPGDFVSSADIANAELQTICGSLSVQDSSWHGTRIAGVLGAGSNNSTGIAGTSWGVRILPVRVLGKCGGYDSDIIAAMRWAAGIAVPGVPDNANPARIVNLSLGGTGDCSAAYRDAVAAVTAKGVLITAAAGNASAVESPANCAGVLAVAGVRHIGSKVGYSSFGPEVGISAPAGNCVNTVGPCLYSILTTTNLGTTSPGANSYTDDAANYNVGTSFSAPLAAGVAALMLSVNPGLQPAELISRIKQSARSFPTDPTLPTCPTLSTTGDSVGQCNCTTSTCGAGLLDAFGAVNAALQPVAVIQPLNSLVVGSIRLDSSASQIASGRVATSWMWSLISGPPGASISNPTASVATLNAVTAGSYVVSLTITDDQNASASSLTTLTVTTAVASGGSGGGALDLPLLLGTLILGGLALRGHRNSSH